MKFLNNCSKCNVKLDGRLIVSSLDHKGEKGRPRYAFKLCHFCGKNYLEYVDKEISPLLMTSVIDAPFLNSKIKDWWKT